MFRDGEAIGEGVQTAMFPHLSYQMFRQLDQEWALQMSTLPLGLALNRVFLAKQRRNLCINQPFRA